MSIKGAEQNSSLDLFRIPPTDLSTVKYRYVKIPPQTSSITPIQVYVERQSDLIDLSRSFVQLDLGFKTTENANLTARAYNVGMMTSPANNHRTKSHISVFLKCGGNMQLHVSVMFT